MGKYLSEAYDHTALFEAEIQPLIEKLNALCKANQIPHVVLVSVSNAPHESDSAVGGDVRIQGAVGFFGPERTPKELLLAAAVRGGEKALALEMLALKLGIGLDDDEEGECPCPECVAEREAAAKAAH